MISVEDAQARVVAGVSVLPAETVPLTDAAGRVLAGPLTARRTQPPFAASAMDGYAVRGEDVVKVPVTLKQVGAVAAGGLHEAAVKAGECVRIFTGAPLPEGADTVVIQEDTEANGDQILIKESEATGRHVRPSGLDFGEGDQRLAAGTYLAPRKLALAAAMNHPWLQVIRRPRVAILATGDEIVFPGEPIAPSQIVASTSTALAGFVASLGAEPVLLGVAQDTVQSLREAAAAARGADILVTIGGASVGEHDLVQTALKQEGLTVDFWKIAMRPGKPLMVGRLGSTQVLGLPGNPVSSLVCAVLFLRPMIFALQGRPDGNPATTPAVTATGLDENGQRQDYMRARENDAGQLEAFGKQDSSMLTALADADALIVRPPHAAAVTAGATVQAILLDGLL